MAKISRRQLAGVLNNMLQDGQPIKKIIEQAAAYLLLERRTKELPSLVRDIMAIRAESGIVEATAISARELQGKIRTELEKLIKENYPNAIKVLLHEELDPAVIGGVRVTAPGLQLDLTVQNRLKSLTQV